MYTLLKLVSSTSPPVLAAPPRPPIAKLTDGEALMPPATLKPPSPPLPPTLCASAPYERSPDVLISSPVVTRVTWLALEPPPPRPPMLAPTCALDAEIPPVTLKPPLPPPPPTLCANSPCASLPSVVTVLELVNATSPATAPPPPPPPIAKLTLAELLMPPATLKPPLPPLPPMLCASTPYERSPSVPTVWPVVVSVTSPDRAPPPPVPPMLTPTCALEAEMPPATLKPPLPPPPPTLCANRPCESLPTPATLKPPSPPLPPMLCASTP